MGFSLQSKLRQECQLELTSLSDLRNQNVIFDFSCLHLIIFSSRRILHKHGFPSLSPCHCYHICKDLSLFSLCCFFSSYWIFFTKFYSSLFGLLSFWMNSPQSFQQIFQEKRPTKSDCCFLVAIVILCLRWRRLDLANLENSLMNYGDIFLRKCITCFNKTACIR